jgi:integrase
VKYLKKVTGPNGEVYLYLRKKGLPLIPLKSPLPPEGGEKGSALEAEIKGLVQAYAAPKAKKGTLGEALRVYETEDPNFLNNAESTKALYRIFLGEFTEDMADLQISAFTPAFILELRNEWARQGYRAANLRLQVLKNVIKPALIADGAQMDPFSLIDGVRRPADLKEPHIIWPEHDVTTVIQAAIEDRSFGLARAVAIGRYVGARRGDLVRLHETARQRGQFRFLSGKKKVPVDMPEDPMLTRWLDATPKSQPQSKWQAHVERKTGVVKLPPRTLVFNTRNSRYTESGLGQALADLVARLAEEGRIESGDYDFHGLRHTRGVEAALAGCTDAQGAALMGHGSPSSFAQYRRQADRLRMSRDGQALILAMRNRTAETEWQKEWQKSGK